MEELEMVTRFEVLPTYFYEYGKIIKYFRSFAIL